MDAEYGIRSTKEFLGGNAFGVIDPLVHCMEYDVVLLRGDYDDGGMNHIPIHISGYSCGKFVGYQTDPEIRHTEFHIAVNDVEPFGDYIDALEFGSWHSFIPCFY